MFFLYQMVDAAFTLYFIMLSVAILTSWFPELGEYKIVRFIRFYTEPYFAVFRQIIPPIGMLDISPIIAFIALRFLESMVKYIILL